MPQYSAFKDIRTVENPVIQQAAKAVVLVELPQGSGTGFFVDGGTKLITNNHVVGASNCLKSGCYIDIIAEFEAGTEPSPSIKLFAVPEKLSPGYDISVLAVFDAATKSPFTFPASLTIDARPAAELIGQHVTLVGHPLGALKKASIGTILSEEGPWLKADFFNLAGTSGSPVLAPDGRVVGINHRGVFDGSSLTGYGAENFALISSGYAIEQLLGNSAPESLALLEEASLRTEGEVLAALPALLNAKIGALPIGQENTSTSILEILANSCDRGLQKTSYADPDAINAALAACYDALRWINCGSKKVEQHTSCPTKEVQAAWITRWENARVKKDQFWQKATVEYKELQTSRAFATSRFDAEDKFSAAYNAQLDRVQLKVDLSLAGKIVYLLDNTRTNYGGVNLNEMLLNYKNVPGYENHAYWIFLGYVSLLDCEIVTEAALKETVLNLVQNKNVSLLNKLDIEAYAHYLGFL